MKHPNLFIAATAGLIAVPLAAQSPADSQCQATATAATGYVPGTGGPSGPDGDRLAGAAKGAAVGAVVGEAQGNQYGRASGAAQDHHRENQAKSGAAAGVAVAGSRNRRERRDERRTTDDQQAAWQTSYDACMAGK